MKKKAILFMLFFMFISTNAMSQSFIFGRVTGNPDDPVSGATVKLWENVCGNWGYVEYTETKSEGYYGFGGIEW